MLKITQNERTLLAVLAQGLVANPLWYDRYITIVQGSSMSNDWFLLLEQVSEIFANKCPTSEIGVKYIAIQMDKEEGAMKEVGRALLRALENRNVLH